MVRDLENYKLAGPALQNATAPIGTASLPHEKTVVLAGASRLRQHGQNAGRATIPAKGPIPFVVQPRAVPSKKSGVIAAIATILLLGFAMGGYAYYRTQIKMRQLQAEIKSKRRTVQRERQASAVPAATPPKHTQETEMRMT